MSLISSISGIRGTIGGGVKEGLSPISVAKFTAAYATFIRNSTGITKPHIVIGRDARLSGQAVLRVVSGTLMASGCSVTDIGLATTPTTEMAVIGLHAQGGIIITASHNPMNWNALKLLNAKGEFLSAKEGEEVLQRANNEDFTFANVEELGSIEEKDWLEQHVRSIIELPEVDVEAIYDAKLRVAFDSVNSVGGIALPYLLQVLGVEEVIPVNAIPDGIFRHNPEPLPKHLTALAEAVTSHAASVGFAVDPDVDRLAIVDENGNFFGEEYTLVAVADYILSCKGPGATVSNLSSSRALKEITERHGGSYSAAAVGEVNVVEKMKETNAIIGGEGNGGVIYPTLHYGRDALVGIALFLTFIAKEKIKVSALRTRYPDLYMAKEKISLPNKERVPEIFNALESHFSIGDANYVDGLKLDFSDRWLHVRTSNTEPILRFYTEAKTEEAAQALAEEAQAIVAELLSK